MTLALSGHVVEAGIAIGRAHKLQRSEIEIAEYAIDPDRADDEIARLRQAASHTHTHLQELAGRVRSSAGSSAEEIIRTHILMLEDSSLVEAAEQHIRKGLCNAEWAMQLQLEALLEGFRAIDDAYIRSRADDAAQVVRMVQQALVSEPAERPLSGVPDRLGQTLVVARELTPGELTTLFERGVAGIITEHGSPYSHTAILARSMGIPTIMGIRRAQSLIIEGEQLVLDGHYGIVFAHPEEPVLSHYLRKQSESHRFRKVLDNLRGETATSLDQQTITLLANAERRDDIRRARDDGAGGVGLYRSEFLFLQGMPPGEEQQLAHYLEALQSLDGAPLTVRTLDLGADKSADLLDFESLRNNPNPALGLRAIRLCLREVELFRIQLRAILRTSAHGPVRCMIPMLTTVQEIRAVRALLNEVADELQAEGHEFDAQMPLGGMIEVPAAALGLEALAPHLDFISVGTNDLIQYTLAADRVDEHVAHLYDPEHPGIVHLLAHIFDTASRLGLPFAVCGEMAADRRYTRLLLGLGLTEFSMQPRALLEIKKVIRETDISRARKAISDWRAGRAGQQTSSLGQYLDRSQLPG
jgi:phosphotransferase system enzyme I (PtsI)